MEKISFKEMSSIMREANRSKSGVVVGVIVFTPDSFCEEYTETERSYRVCSDSKCFNDNMISNSIYGDCLDGVDIRVRLDWYMNAKEGAWKVDYCYIEQE